MRRGITLAVTTDGRVTTTTIHIGVMVTTVMPIILIMVVSTIVEMVVHAVVKAHTTTTVKWVTATVGVRVTAAETAMTSVVSVIVKERFEQANVPPDNAPHWPTALETCQLHPPIAALTRVWSWSTRAAQRSGKVGPSLLMDQAIQALSNPKAGLKSDVMHPHEPMEQRRQKVKWAARKPELPAEPAGQFPQQRNSKVW
jgi:hypothetical protein